MAKKIKKRKCVNCARPKRIIAKGLCTLCYRAAHNLTGINLERALADARRRVKAAKGGRPLRSATYTKYNLSDRELKVIKDLYDGTPSRLNVIMHRLGRKYPRTYVRRIARTLELARHTKPWTKREEDYLLENCPRMGLKALRRGLERLSGIKRTETAIRLKQKRLGIQIDCEDGFSLRGLMLLLYRDQENHYPIHRWVSKGWLRGRRRGTLRTKAQGGDEWYFDTDAVRNFIIAHPEEIDQRMVDFPAFIKLLAGGSPLIAHCRCPQCKADYKMVLFNPDNGINWRYCNQCMTAPICHEYGISDYDTGTVFSSPRMAMAGE